MAHVGDRTKGLDAIAGGIAHDFNNVLQIIAGNLAMISRELGEDSVARRHVASAMAGVDMGTSLARRVLRKEASQEAPASAIDLSAVLLSMRGLVSDAVGEQVSVRFDIPDARLMVQVQDADVQNVVLNLAINAAHAMAGSGDLQIAINEDGPQGVVLSMTDDGCGMAAEIAARVFDTGFTTKGEAGYGLGLAGVRRFAEEAGGTVSLETAIGCGTTIRVHLPVAPCRGTGI
jgi:signal transduction histidine kinase